MTNKLRDRLLFAWSILVFTLAFKIEEQFQLGFWKYMLISVPMLTIGYIAIDVFIKVEKKYDK